LPLVLPSKDVARAGTGCVDPVYGPSSAFSFRLMFKGRQSLLRRGWNLLDDFRNKAGLDGLCGQMLRFAPNEGDRSCIGFGWHALWLSGSLPDFYSAGGY
jgi:hypothetical protein